MPNSTRSSINNVLPLSTHGPILGLLSMLQYPYQGPEDYVNVKHIYIHVVMDVVFSNFITCLWTSKWSLLVHGQVNGQNPLIKSRFTGLKIDIFLISQRRLVGDTH